MGRLGHLGRGGRAEVGGGEEHAGECAWHPIGHRQFEWQLGAAMAGETARPCAHRLISCSRDLAPSPSAMLSSHITPILSKLAS